MWTRVQLLSPGEQALYVSVLAILPLFYVGWKSNYSRTQVIREEDDQCKFIISDEIATVASTTKQANVFRAYKCYCT